MLQDLNQIILAGGITHCTSHWSKRGADSLDECLKLYLPLDGSAELLFDNSETDLLADNIYLINGNRIESQSCLNAMNIAWLHFSPASLKLKHLLFKHFTFQKWSYDEISFIKELLYLVGKAFSCGPDVLKPTVNYDKFDSEDFVLCKICSMLIYFIGEVIQKKDLKSNTQELAVFQRLGPAINFMDQNFQDNPSLEEISGKVFMAPASFHRVFKNSFGITPFEHMLSKRLLKARQLLSTTSLNVREIALACGYENEFYFSRIFKKRYGLSPSQQRNKEWTA